MRPFPSTVLLWLLLTVYAQQAFANEAIVIPEPAATTAETAATKPATTTTATVETTASAGPATQQANTEGQTQSTEAADSNSGYLEQLALITPTSSLDQFKSLWQAYLRSETYFIYINNDQDEPFEKLLSTVDSSQCEQQMPYVKTLINDHLPDLLLQYLAMRCYAVLGDTQRADRHEAYFTKLSQVMTADGDGSSVDSPLWAGSLTDALSFLSVSGYQPTDGLFFYNEDHDAFFYYLAALDEDHQSHDFTFYAGDIINSLIRAQAYQLADGNPLAFKTWDSQRGRWLIMPWLAEHGEAGAAIFMGDILSDNNNRTSLQAALNYYAGGAELGNSIAADRYAKLVLKNDFEQQYETAVDYLGNTLEQRNCFAVTTFIQMQEKSLGTERDQDIIDGLIELCARESGRDEYLNDVAWAFYSAHGRHYDLDLANKYWQLAADNGHHDSQHRLALNYINGNGFDQDIEHGMSVLKTLGEQGHLASYSDLGFHLQRNPEYREQFGSLVEFTTIAAQDGYARAQHNLGYYYLTGIDTEADPQKALQWYKTAADQGYTNSYWSVGQFYLEGTAVPADYAQAKHYLDLAAANNSKQAMNALGYMHERGLGVEKDMEQARQWYEKAVQAGNRLAEANLHTLEFRISGPYLEPLTGNLPLITLAEQNDPEAMTALGVLHAFGYRAERSNIDSRRWLKRAIDSDYAPAFYIYSAGEVRDETKRGKRASSNDRERLEIAAKRGIGAAAYTLAAYYHSRADGYDDDDMQEAFQYYLRGALLNHPAAMFLTADFYEKGKGTPVDLKQALHWYHKAAEHGHITAMNTLGVIQIKQKNNPQSIQQAIDYFKQAADRGSVLAMRNLAQVYNGGIYIERDIQQAVEWYIAASDKQDVEAYVRLGELLTVEDELGPSHTIARIYFAAAARNNNHEGLFWLARSYQLEPAEQISNADIYELYETAAEAGNSWARNNMGVMHLAGTAVDADEDDAEDHFEEAHEAGNHSATANLAWCYEHGVGLRQNQEKALRLYTQAAEAGSPFALARLIQWDRNAQQSPLSADTKTQYQLRLRQAMQNKVLTTAAQSMIPLPEAKPARQEGMTDHNRDTTAPASDTGEVNRGTLHKN